MPFLAILRYDLRTLLSSWLVRLWLAGSVLLTLLMMATGWAQLPSAALIALLLFPYLVFPWFLVVMVLGVDPVSGARVEALADGILSRPITRYEYLLASWAARLVVVLGGYLVVVVPAIIWVALARRSVAADPVTVYGVIAALAVVSLVLTLQVSLGYCLGTILRRPLLAIVVLLFLWYPINLILDVFALQEFSPISLNRALPTLLRTSWRAKDGVKTEEALGFEDLADRTAKFLSVFGGATPEPARKPGFFERDKDRAFSLPRVVLGYGVPTLCALGLTLLIFCRRDL